MRQNNMTREQFEKLHSAYKKHKFDLAADELHLFYREVDYAAAMKSLGEAA